MGCHFLLQRCPLEWLKFLKNTTTEHCKSVEHLEHSYTGSESVEWSNCLRNCLEIIMLNIYLPIS